MEKKPKLTFHFVPHTAASLMVQNGVSLHEVAKILGHSTTAVAMRYAHFAPEAAGGAVGRPGRAAIAGEEEKKNQADGA